MDGCFSNKLLNKVYVYLASFGGFVFAHIFQLLLLAVFLCVCDCDDAITIHPFCLRTAFLCDVFIAVGCFSVVVVVIGADFFLQHFQCTLNVCVCLCLFTVHSL